MTFGDESIRLAANRNRPELIFSGDFKESIFGRDLMKMPLPQSWQDKDIQKNYDKYNTYTLNNYDYRGPDFKDGVDVITAGCSFTFGVGVPDNGTWPDQYSKISGNSYVNISTPGASIEWVIESIYRYINKFGKPNKGIVILFPDLFRQEVVIDSITNKTLEISKNDFVPQYYDDLDQTYLGTYIPYENLEIPNIAKKPFPIEYTVLLKESIKRNVLKIKDFERYCEAANINLYWSSWSDVTTWIYSRVPEKYKSSNYIKLEGLTHWKSHFFEIEKTEQDPEGIVDYKIVHDPYNSHGCTKEMNENGKCICFSSCHFEIEKDFPDSFHVASDRWNTSGGNYHYGVHRLIHIAEDFVNLTKDW